ncbi:MAG: fructosamine kinase family protein [Synechococcaceae cyanobacterium]
MALPSSPGGDPLAGWLAERLGRRLVGRSPVGGGGIHRAWCLRLDDGARLFAKTAAADALALLEGEADGLVALAAAADPALLVVPAPLALGVVAGQAVLVLPWLDLGPGSGWWGLGAALARMHRHSLEGPLCPGDRVGQAFGWPVDNTIGATPQANGWLADWGRFFQERRLAPQLALLAGHRQALPGADDLLDRVPVWLSMHQPEACLVHGDLWSGNAGLLPDGRGALFDPAAHRADREVDLAMARLFGGFPAEFFRGYDETWPLPHGHGQRAELYNLYHLLNHANLFGGPYVAQARATITRLLQAPPQWGLA